MSTTKPAGPVIRWYYCLFPFLLATEPSKSGHAARTWSIWPTALPGKSNSRPASECVRTRARTKARTHECKPAQAHTDALAHPRTHASILTHKHARTRAHLSSQFLACWHTHSASQQPAPTCDLLSPGRHRPLRRRRRCKQLHLARAPRRPPAPRQCFAPLGRRGAPAPAVPRPSRLRAAGGRRPSRLPGLPHAS